MGSDYVRTAALNMLAALKPLRDKPDVRLQEWRTNVPEGARSALWLVDVCAKGLMEQLNEPPMSSTGAE